jgi:drug/metabolite transporter (DMT)-like permease
MTLLALPSRRQLQAAAAPGIFVLLWSTGFVGGMYGLSYAPPFAFLAWRFLIVTAITGAVALLWRAPWPRRPREIGHIAVAGLLVQGLYPGGVFAGLSHGVSPGVSALIVGVQPLLTAFFAGPLLGERVSRLQWLGFAIGFAGVALVVSRSLRFDSASLIGFAACLVALCGITFGTLYQKRFCAGLDLRSGVAIQYAAAAVLMLLLTLSFEHRPIEWTGQFVSVLLYLSVALSVGAVSLLYWLIRRGAASRVASLFYLVPPVTAIIAYLFLGETLGIATLVGFALAAAGVALVTRSPVRP